MWVKDTITNLTDGPIGIMVSNHIDLHEGWVKGEERIVTTLAGVRGWPGSTDLHRVYRYDGRGIEAEHGWYSTVRENGVSTQADPGFNEMAIIERVPMMLEADAPANVLIREYSDEAIRIDVRARGETRLTIRNGAFPVVAGKRYFVMRGGETREATAQTDGVLTIVDVVKAEVDYAIRPAQ